MCVNRDCIRNTLHTANYDINRILFLKRESNKKHKKNALITTTSSALTWLSFIDVCNKILNYIKSTTTLTEQNLNALHSTITLDSFYVFALNFVFCCALTK